LFFVSFLCNKDLQFQGTSAENIFKYEKVVLIGAGIGNELITNQLIETIHIIFNKYEIHFVYGFSFDHFGEQT
jgi:hypothetical protein